MNRNRDAIYSRIKKWKKKQRMFIVKDNMPYHLGVALSRKSTALFLILLLKQLSRAKTQ